MRTLTTLVLLLVLLITAQTACAQRPKKGEVLKEEAPPEPDACDFSMSCDAAFDSADLQSRIVYPASALAHRIEGVVLVRALVSKLGDVRECTVVRSDDSLLEEAVVQAVCDLRCKPAVQNKFPVEQRLNIEVTFVLTRSDSLGSAAGLSAGQP